MPLPDRPKDDSNREIHEAAIKKAAEEFAEMQQEYLDRLWGRLLGLITFWNLGTCTGIDTASKTATVRADPVTGKNGEPVTAVLTLAWGREHWAAGQIVGKRVRFGMNLLTDYGYIIDTVTNE